MEASTNCRIVWRSPDGVETGPMPMPSRMSARRRLPATPAHGQLPGDRGHRSLTCGGRLRRQPDNHQHWAVRAQREATNARYERNEANRNFALARQAVEDYLAKVTESRRLKEADFHALRKELL